MEKLIRSKRGELGENLVIMVLAVAAFAIVLWALGGVLSHAESAEAENLCRSSVALRASSMTTLDAKVISGEVKSPLFCKVIDEKISGDKEELMSQISEKMADCWKMFGEGRYEEILQGTNFNLLFFGTDKLKNDCFTCYTLIIDEDKIEGTNNYPEEGKITSQEMSDYLRKEEHPTVNTTFLDYFQSYGGPGKVVILAPEALPRSVYAVGFLAKNKDKSSGWGDAAVKIIGAVGVVLIGVGTGGTGFIVLTAATAVALGTSGFNNLKAQLYQVERGTSGIYLDTLESSEKNCFKGDLAGE